MGTGTGRQQSQPTRRSTRVVVNPPHGGPSDVPPPRAAKRATKNPKRSKDSERKTEVAPAAGGDASSCLEKEEVKVEGEVEVEDYHFPLPESITLGMSPRITLDAQHLAQDLKLSSRMMAIEYVRCVHFLNLVYLI